MARSKTSKKWLHEHFKDQYVIQAKKEGLRSRAVYKLKEINDRDKLLKRDTTVVDLGAAPGGWSEYASSVVGKKGLVVASDILPMDRINFVEFVQGDFNEPIIVQSLENLLENRAVSLVMSDMAPNVSGIVSVDQARMMNLAEMALDFAASVLSPGGDFLIKVFQGAGIDEYKSELRKVFKKVIVRKPGASRPRSREIYLLARGYKL